MRLAKVRKAIEAGQLDPLAKEIALYQLMPPGHDSVMDIFNRFGACYPFGDGLTPEQAKRSREFMQTYMDVADTLGPADAPMYGLVALLLLMDSTEEETDAHFDAWCLRYGRAFPKALGVQKRLKELRRSQGD